MSFHWEVGRCMGQIIACGRKDLFLLMKKIYLVLGIVEKKPYLCTIHLGITYKVQIITYSFKI